MARRRHGNPGAPGGDPEDRGPAPADLLQMWISGNTGPSLEALDADAEPVEESEPDDQVEESEPHDQADDVEDRADDAEAQADPGDQPPSEEPDSGAEPDEAEPQAEAETVDADHGDPEANAPGVSADQQDVGQQDAEPVEDDVAPDDATDLAEPAAEPETADDADVADPPTAERSWWPSDDQDETPAEPAADPSRWWPYAETEAQDPTAADGPVESAKPTEPEPTPTAGETAEPAPDQAAPVERVDPAADEALWHDDVEAEWVDTDGDAEAAHDESAGEPEADVAEPGDAAPGDDAGAETRSDTAPDETPPAEVADAESPPADLPGPRTDLEEANRARGWASFGAAPTAEDVLDRIDIHGSWSDRFLGGPPIATPRVSSDTTSQAPPADQVAAPEAEPRTQDDDDAVREASDDTAVEAAAADVTEAESGPATPAAVHPRGLDMSSTAHWTLDDFEEYIRSQSGNELSEWIGGEPHEEPEDAGAEDGPAQVEAPADETAVPGTPDSEVPATESQDQTDDGAATEDTTDETPSDAAELETTESPAPTEEAETPSDSDSVLPVASEVEEPVEHDPADAAAPTPAEPVATSDAAVAAEPDAAPAPKDQPSRVRGLLARMGLTREPEVQEDDSADVTATHDTVEEPVVDQGPAARSWDPDATEHYDWTSAEFDGPPPWATDEPADEEPVPAPGVTEPFAVVQAPSEPEPVETDEAASEQGSDADPLDEEDEDHQEWYDDAGLRWTSDDGGYTWFSTDGQGWNAEIGEPIEIPVVSPSASSVVPPTVLDAPSDTATEVTRDAESPADPAPEGSDEAPWPDAPADDAATRTLSHDGWPEAEPATGHATEPADDDTAAYWPEVDAHPDADEQPDAETVAEPVESTTADSPRPDHAQPPQFVEYKPRGAHRPLLGVLFVAAAVFAVVAIFWAFSKGSQSATGIAIGVTGFALAFWWGLLSWTPTVVSVHGAILEVARGSDGERFDLRSPRLRIDVDDDTASRNWRTTITRPNGTELVIPASAVDTDEFTEIVNHYRAEATKSSGTATDS